MSFVGELAKDMDIMVVATIHQPSSTVFNSFHGTLLLSDGRVVFQVGGRCTRVANYSTNQCPLQLQSSTASAGLTRIAVCLL